MRVRLGLGLLLAVVLPACHDKPTPPPPPPDVAPGTPAASPLSTSSVQLTWADLSSNEAGFRIQTSPDDAAWTTRLTRPAGATSAVVSSLASGVLTYFRVVAFTAAGELPSTSVSLTLPQPAWETSITGPASLYWTCSAFDSLRRHMLVYGGRDASAQSDKLWSLDLAAAPPVWSEVTPAMGNTPPTARIGSSLIYDPLGDRLILFGGQAGGGASNAELWEFRLSTSEWFTLPATGTAPSARLHHTAVYDSLLDRMIVFGGDSAGTFPSDVRALALPATGTPAWSSLTLFGTPPTPRKHHSAIYDGDNSRMVVFAGLDNDLGDGSTQAVDVWALDLSAAATATWSAISAPGGPTLFRDGAMAAWNSVSGQMVVFGGGDELSTPMDEIWTLELRSAPAWTQLNSVAPAPGVLQYGTAVFDPVAPRMVIFGGTVDDFLTPTNQTHLLGL